MSAVNNVNGFDLLIAVVFTIKTKLVVLGPKAQYLMISFCLGEGETIPQYHLIFLQVRSEKFLLQDDTGQINNPTGKYITEL